MMLSTAMEVFPNVVLFVLCLCVPITLKVVADVFVVVLHETGIRGIRGKLGTENREEQHCCGNNNCCGS